MKNAGKENRGSNSLCEKLFSRQSSDFLEAEFLSCLVYSILKMSISKKRFTKIKFTPFCDNLFFINSVPVWKTMN